MSQKTKHEASMSRLPGNRSAKFVPYLIPGLIGLFAVVVVPFIWNIYLSFTRWRGVGPVKWVGLKNWKRLFSDSTFWISFANSFWIIVAIVVIPTILGLFISSLLTDVIQKKFGGKTASFLRALFYLPQLLPVAVAAIIMAGSSARRTVPSTHCSPRSAWVHCSTTGWAALTAHCRSSCSSWCGSSSATRLSSSCRACSASIRNSTRPQVLTAPTGGRSSAWSPCRPSSELLVVILTATIGALKTFAPVYLLTKGGPGTSTTVPSYYSYNQFFQVQQVATVPQSPQR